MTEKLLQKYTHKEIKFLTSKLLSLIYFAEVKSFGQFFARSSEIYPVPSVCRIGFPSSSWIIVPLSS